MQDNPIAFYTATILNWQKLLKPDKYKEIIINSLCFLVSDQRIWLYGFVIMPNPIHLLWRMQENRNRSDVQRDFMKYTAQKIKLDLIDNHPQVLSLFQVAAKAGLIRSGSIVPGLSLCIVVQ